MDINHLLSKTIDLKSAYKSNPELFDLKKLSIIDYVSLIKYDQATFLDAITPYILKPDDKFKLIVNLGNSIKYKKIKDRFALKPEEVSKLSNPFYFELLKSDFNTYINKERFEKLSTYDQSLFCLKKPQWFLDNFAILPKLTVNNLFALAENEPKFVDEQVKDFTDLSTVEGFWDYMIKYNSKYEDIFLKNTKSLSTKTDVRMLMRKHPRLVKKIDENVILNSKLNVKEWILLTDEIIRNNKNIFKNWEFKDDLKKIFREDLMAEVLMGKSKISKRSQNAMDKVIKITKVKDDSEEKEG